jgi:hypothetical protein
MKFTTEEKWHQLWGAAENEATKFSEGKEREDLMRKARSQKRHPRSTGGYRRPA